MDLFVYRYYFSQLNDNDMNAFSWIVLFTIIVGAGFLGYKIFESYNDKEKPKSDKANQNVKPRPKNVDNFATVKDIKTIDLNGSVSNG